MFIFVEALICIMVLLFPLMLYSYYVLYKKNIFEKEKRVIQNLALLTSVFLIINVVNYFDNSIYFVFITIPILFSYIYRNNFMVVFIFVIISIYLYSSLNINIFLLLIANLFYIIVYIQYTRTNKNTSYLVFSFCIITITVFIIEYFKTFNLVDTKLIFMIFLFILFCFIISCLVKKVRDIVNIYLTLKEFEHEKQIKTSLFKITHEIKNPLAVIKGYIEMYDADNVDKSKRYIKIIESEVKRILNLLDDFRNFSDIKIKKETTNFNDLLDDIKNTILPIAKKDNINYILETENDLIVELDYNRMKQVMINLIKNAIEASNINGEVKIISFIDNNKLNIIIKDCGVGMSKETMDNLLNPFFTTKSFGTGLGVCLSNEIINAHGGSLDYYSHMNEGTSFFITLPLK